jgi:Tetratricopeptide repeat
MLQASRKLMLHGMPLLSVRSLIAMLFLLVAGLLFVVRVSPVKHRHQESAPVSADDKHTRLKSEAGRLHLQVRALRLDSRFTEAIPIAQRALLIREEFPGKQSLEYAESLNDLGALYREINTRKQFSFTMRLSLFKGLFWGLMVSNRQKR